MPKRAVKEKRRPNSPLPQRFNTYQTEPPLHGGMRLPNAVQSKEDFCQ